MNNKKTTLKQSFLDHLKKYWNYKQDVWKRKQEEIQYQRRQQYIQERKEDLYGYAKQLQQELFLAFQHHHYPCVRTITNDNDITIEKIDPRSTNLFYFKIQLTTTGSIQDEYINIKNQMNQAISDLRNCINRDYQYFPEDAYIDYPFITNGIYVVSVHQQGSYLHLTVKSSINL